MVCKEESKVYNCNIFGKNLFLLLFYFHVRRGENAEEEWNIRRSHQMSSSIYTTATTTSVDFHGLIVVVIKM